MQTTGLLPFILPEVTGCPEPLLLQAINQVAFDFFDKSGAWLQKSSEIALTGATAYAMPAVSDAIALRIRDVWLNGLRLDPEPVRELFTLSYSAHDGQNLEVAESLSGTLLMRVVYAPSMTATTLPDLLMNRYLYPIAAGVKSRLMLMPGQPWTNPQLAKHYEGIFWMGIGEARSDVEHGHTEGSLRVVPRRFG